METRETREKHQKDERYSYIDMEMGRIKGGQKGELENESIDNDRHPKDI